MVCDGEGVTLGHHSFQSQSATTNIKAQLTQRSDSGEVEGYNVNWSSEII